MRENVSNMVALLLKAVVFTVITAIFFGVYSIQHPWLLKLSRTTGITLVTFIVLLFVLTVAYGGFAVGKQKSKPIIYSMVISSVITDVITTLQLSIMNTHDGFRDRFVFASPLALLGVIAAQIVFIIPFTYFSNYLYFKFKRPERSCVITKSDEDANEIIAKISRFKKQYEITDIIMYDSPELYKVINRNDTVFIYEIPMGERDRIVEYCYRCMKNIYYNFEICDIVSYGSGSMMLDDKALVMSEVKGLTIGQRFAKRLLDILLSFVMLIIASPFMLVCALLIKLDDGGSVFFRQKRATRDGRVFSVLKFRTMKEDNSVNRSVTTDDDRITRVGAKLRKFRLDELPQIINIFLGDMSIVGPRPEMLENVEKYTEQLPEFSYRLRVKAGLTGYAQIAGKYNTSPKDKLMMDLMYIERYSIWQDLKLIIQTITVFFKSEKSTEAFEVKKDEMQNEENSAE